MAQAQYRQLGKSGLCVSIPIFGGMSFGSLDWGRWIVPEDKALVILKAAWDRGINTIDTANMYSNGTSEQIIGKFIKKYEIRREQIIIMTKAFFVVAEDPSIPSSRDHLALINSKEYVNQGGLSRAALFNQVEGSLSRLGTSYIDVLQIHTFDPFTPPEETMKALHDLVQSGKVRYLGACNMRCWQLAVLNSVAEKNGWTTFVSMQLEHSLLYRNDELEMIPYCQYKGIGLVCYSPLMTGFLARPLGQEPSRKQYLAGTIYDKSARPSDEQIIKRVEEVAKKKGWSMSTVALTWVVMKVTSPIVGINKVEHIEDSIVTGKMLTADEMQYLEELYEIQRPRF